MSAETEHISIWRWHPWSKNSVLLYKVICKPMLAEWSRPKSSIINHSLVLPSLTTTLKAGVKTNIPFQWVAILNLLTQQLKPLQYYERSCKTYLIFVISFTQAGFFSQICTPKNNAKHPKITTNTPKKGEICSSLRSIWKILHRTDLFYTGTARGARDKYEVCSLINCQ